ncbi:hypothetical protein JYT28_00725 [Desulfobulbus sp. AH-315-M07]|nr:hypothetical protein [Desulfobulbus sp. AH-315-M07]
MNTSGTRSWFTKGYDEILHEEQRLAIRSGPHRLLVPVGKSKQVVLIDGDPFCFREHTVGTGRGRQYITCLRGGSPDPICCELLPQHTARYVGYLTAIDTEAWVDKDGRRRQYGITLYRAPTVVLRELDRIRRHHRDLRGTVIRAHRETARSALGGNRLTWVDWVALDSLFAKAQYRGRWLSDLLVDARRDDHAAARLERVFQLVKDDTGTIVDTLVPFAYRTLLAPRTPDEVREQIRMAADLPPKKGSRYGWWG